MGFYGNGQKSSTPGGNHNLESFRIFMAGVVRMKRLMHLATVPQSRRASRAVVCT